MTPHIPCSEYDYFEIACTYRMKVELYLKNGQSLSGIATGLNIERVKGIATEWLTLEAPENRVELTQIKRLSALEKNPHFSQIDLHPEN